MLIISWNCRGLGRLAAKRSLKSLVRQHRPDCIFILETKLSKEQTLVTFERLGYSHCFISPARGRAGGIALGIREGLDFEPISISENIITVMFYSHPVTNPWMCRWFTVLLTTSQNQNFGPH